MGTAGAVELVIAWLVEVTDQLGQFFQCGRQCVAIVIWEIVTGWRQSAANQRCGSEVQYHINVGPAGAEQLHKRCIIVPVTSEQGQ